MRKSVLGLVLMTLLSFTARADQGMWLMEQLARKYSTLKARGLQMQEYDLYNPNGTSLKDAVVSFDGGCTGEVISSQGLVMTNHHCGYDAIQKLSSVEHNYLNDGYWAKTLQDELPARGVVVTFIDKIEDVTTLVKEQLVQLKGGTGMEFLSPSYLNGIARKFYSERYQKGQRGIDLEIKPFYNGNKYLLFVKKVYSDIRFVGAPPSSVGKFGADTDNWSYPRHTGDFSLFRIYADANGNPAPYSEQNVPLRPKRWFDISTSGVQEGDFAMIMGFPGRTNQFALPREIKEWGDIDNSIRIRMRGLRQEVMLAEMLADPKVNIMYASKYARSQNGYKRAIGANWGIARPGFLDASEQMADRIYKWAYQLSEKKKDNRYLKALDDMRFAIDRRAPLRSQYWWLDEGLWQSIEAMQAPGLDLPLTSLERSFQSYCNKDYSPQVDAKIAKVIIAEYLKQVNRQHWPHELAAGFDQYGSAEAYVDAVYAGTRFTTPEGFASFAKLSSQEQTKVLRLDPLARLATSVREKMRELQKLMKPQDDIISKSRRTYLEALDRIDQEQGRGAGLIDYAPDANSTLRFTFGQVKGYSPRDGVRYGLPTTLDGVMSKEDSSNWEFVVPERLKEIYRTQSYGQGKHWAIKRPDGSYAMPVNFIATTHTTGGNSGSPVFNAKGQLIGINFDRNWEGVAGDIKYLPDYQRSIICDIRYVLLIIDELGGAKRIIDELSLVP